MFSWVNTYHMVVVREKGNGIWMTGYPKKNASGKGNVVHLGLTSTPLQCWYTVCYTYVDQTFGQFLSKSIEKREKLTVYEYQNAVMEIIERSCLNGVMLCRISHITKQTKETNMNDIVNRPQVRGKMFPDNLIYGCRSRGQILLLKNLIYDNTLSQW